MRSRILPWCIPAVVALTAILLSETWETVLVAAGLGALVVLLLVPRPAVALIALIVFLPLEQVGLPMLLAVGVPASAVRAVGGFKEATVVALLLAAAVEVVKRRPQPDRLDLAILGYVAVVSAELLLPRLFGAISPTPLHERLLAWRDDCAYAVVALAVRHAPFPPGIRRAFVAGLAAMAALLVAVGLYQRADPGGFEQFIVYTAQVPHYLQTILHEPADEIAAGLANLKGTHPLRITSLLLYPFDLGDYLIVAAAILAELVVRPRRARGALTLLVASIVAIYLTEIRGDLLAAGIVLVAALLPAPGRTSKGRGKLALVLGLALLAAIPVLGASRYLGGHGASASTGMHQQELTQAVSTFFHHPFGLGLGNQPSTAPRFHTLGGNAVVGDNSTLQVGIELGVEGLIPWLSMMVLFLYESWRRRSQADPLAVGAGMALLGLLIAGQTHPAFVSYPPPWTVMAALGLALRPAPPQESTVEEVLRARGPA